MPGIRDCLESLGVFAEVIVQDGGSTDGTREAARSFSNVRLLEQNPALLDPSGRIEDFSAVRNDGIRAARHDWIFVVDSDERMDSALVEEIRTIVERNVPGVYRAFRRFYLDDKPIIFCAGYPAYQIRLFHRSCTDGYVKPVHERLQLHGGVAVQTLASELPVPLPPVASLPAKEERYLALEVRRFGVLPWGAWLRKMLLRKLLSATWILLRALWLRVLLRPGLRMPFAYEWSGIRYALRVMVWTCPPITRRKLKTEVQEKH